MIDSSNISNRQKWIYNFMLTEHFKLYGEYPNGQKPIPNILLKISDLSRNNEKVKL